MDTTSCCWDERKKELLAMVEQARSEALSEKEIDERQDKVNRSTANFLAGNSTWQEYQEALKVENVPGAVFVETLPEFRVVMQFGRFTETEIQDTLAHENEHMLEALKNPAKRRYYRLLFMKSPDRGFGMSPSVWIVWPDKKGEESDREKTRQLIAAPEILSDTDIAQLREITPKVSPRTSAS